MRLLQKHILARIYNCHQVDSQIFRSAQMYGNHISFLLEFYRIASVINLRGANQESIWYHSEIETCRDLGVIHLDIPLHSRRLPKQSTLLQLVSAFESANRPILLKCSGGADRTALASALYILHHHGPSAYKMAMKQLAFFPYLHFPMRHQRWIKYFPKFFKTYNEGVLDYDWVNFRYTTDLFAEWLQKRDLENTWRH